MTPEAAKRLAVATIECAVLDAKGTRKADRPTAVAWLASTKALPWFDMLDIDQQYFLEQSEWQRWARATLVEAPEGEERDLIQATLTMMGMPPRFANA